MGHSSLCYLMGGIDLVGGRRLGPKPLRRKLGKQKNSVFLEIELQNFSLVVEVTHHLLSEIPHIGSKQGSVMTSGVKLKYV